MGELAYIEIAVVSLLVIGGFMCLWGAYRVVLWMWRQMPKKKEKIDG